MAILELDTYAAVIQKAMIAEAEGDLYQKEKEGRKRKSDSFRSQGQVSFQGNQNKKPRFQASRNPNFKKPEIGNSGNASNTGTPGVVTRPQLTNQQRQQQRPPLPECKTCGKRHPGICNRLSGTCFKCNQKGHFARDCKVGVVCHRCGKPGHISKECKAPVPANMMMQAIEAPPAVEPTVPARIQNLTMREAVRDTDVIAGTLLVNSN